MRIPKSHPRYESLKTREELVKYWEKGLVATQGLIAQGRGEAFDYLIGERTTEHAKIAERAAACMLLLAEKPVISVNGNTAALAAKDLVKLSKLTNAKLEVNLFHHSKLRTKKIAEFLRKFGAKEVLGEKPDAKIPDLKHARALCAKEGIFSADVVLVALEDGDRTEAIVRMGKKVIAIDLNPLSRTAQTADITIVDNITRAVKVIIREVNSLRKAKESELKSTIKSFNNNRNLKEALRYITERLKVIKWY
ncbi:MAG: 4-phosphopantoate--beta-alanine ligase [Candidatus Thermoplasmatota archaeon]|nr:4-phosphopantoate--beta-alanine ligase [Candidatus Thermoplasmatota archaeon]